MPRFFFDTRDDEEVITDDVGIELADVAQAKVYAAKSLAELALDALPGATRRCLGVDVSDEEHRPVLTTELTYEARFVE
ncbi:MAG TPA: hypothetical protein VF552_03980 [Allosphingosinicella sp.]|jgi:hypothetical protein